MTKPGVENRLNSITSETLAPLVSNALGVGIVQMGDWEYEAIHGGIGGGELYRFHGQVNAQDQLWQWMLILKIIRADSEFVGDDPSTWNYWKREALAYQSGLLDDLPGRLKAPRCFGVHQLTEHEIWIWLEAIPDETIVEWPLKQYGISARHLGQFNGIYLTGRLLPFHSWFSNGRINEWLVDAEEVFPQFHVYLENPLAQKWFPDNVADRTSQLWLRRRELLDGIAKLPRTLCHHDAFRRNLIAGKDQGEQDITFAFDWSMIGHGVIGEEIATTFTVSLQFLDCPAKFASQLDALIFEGYLAGLRDAGWKGKPEVVRFDFITSAVLFMALGGAGVLLSMIIDENGQAEIERFLQRPLEDIIAEWSKMQVYLLDLGDEALTLQEAIE